METIKVKFVDFWEQFCIESNWLYQMLSTMYNIMLSDTPDYLFYSSFGVNHLKYKDCVKIFITGESHVPDFNLCDYGIGFDYLSFSDRYFRLPIYYYYGDTILDKMMSRHKIPLQERVKFCSFTVSNGNSDGRRDAFFRELQKYKRVDSGGRYLNNIGMPQGVEDKFAFDTEHKFSICFENESYPGYTTEKLPQAFAAGCIPIYWGDPCVGDVFNEKAFVNCNKYETMEDAIKRIIEIDNDDNIYHQMMSEPAMINYKDYPENVIKEFGAFLYHIFNQPLEKAKRRSRCPMFQAYSYNTYLRGTKSTKKLLLESIKERLK